MQRQASRGTDYESHRESRQHGDLELVGDLRRRDRRAIPVLLRRHHRLDRQRVDLHFLVDAATFLMVFVIEHTQSREVAALHTKLDAIIRALDADTSTVGIEELSQKEIQEIRDRRRERTPGARAQS